MIAAILDETDDADLCDHDEREIEILTGRARCDQCGHRWNATEEEVQNYIRAFTP